MHTFFRICVTCAVLLTSCSSDERHDVIVIYPDQEPIDREATLFAAGSISTDAIEHSAPSFAPDGKTVLWAIMHMPSYQTSLLQMNFSNGKWSAPFKPSFSDTTANEIHPTFSPDGNILYFSSDRKLPGGQPTGNGNRIWKVEKTKHGWMKPVPLDSLVSKGGEYALSVASNNNLYFSFGPFRSPDWNIMISELANGNRKPFPVSDNINSPGYEDGVYVAPDESFLIFESDRAGGVKGSIDLYISFKGKTGEWTPAINMGNAVNSSASERFAKVSPDGKYLFFGSNRRYVNNEPNFDIYWIDAAIINDLKNTAIQKFQ